MGLKAMYIAAIAFLIWIFTAAVLVLRYGIDSRPPNWWAACGLLIVVILLIGVLLEFNPWRNKDEHR